MAAYYPPAGFHFSVKFFGLGKDNDSQFQEVSGLTAEVSVEELIVGGENKFTYRLPTRSKYNNLVLKRGMLKDSDLVEWFRKAIEDFDFKPVNLTVNLLDENHQPLSTWDFVAAYPVKWVISDFKAMENGLVVETIELAYQYFSRKK